jgi:branched-chain amino acid transport system substrate-binding protein
MKTVNISAAKSVVGTQLKFDKNGDILSKDISVILVKDKKETFKQKITVK